MDQNTAGLYIHIPFCRHKCRYCSFCSTASSEVSNDYIDALLNEITTVQSLDLKFDTLYFGGGTPSLLSPQQFDKIIRAINKALILADSPEITVEANPDSASYERLKSFRQSGANRISIGVQSMANETLHFLGRIHTLEQAVLSIKNARCAGFDNMSLDLIYGIPGFPLNHAQFEHVLDLNPEHLATYVLRNRPGQADR